MIMKLKQLCEIQSNHAALVVWKMVYLIGAYWDGTSTCIFHFYEVLSPFVFCKFLWAVTNCPFTDFSKILMHIYLSSISWHWFCRPSSCMGGILWFWASLKCCVDMVASALKYKCWNFLEVKYLDFRYGACCLKECLKHLPLFHHWQLMRACSVKFCLCSGIRGRVRRYCSVVLPNSATLL